MIYLTFLAKQKAKQITFEDLLNNPFMTLAETDTDRKKVTVMIDEEYGEKLYQKRNTVLPESPWDAIIKDIKTEEHYRHFEIPKKSDPRKKRPIDAPDELIGSIQNYYKEYIEKYLQVLPHKAAHAYVPKHGTLTAMQQHQKNESKWFLQLDLSNFFNSINGEWLKEMLLKVYPFPYIKEETLDNIIKISLLNNALPQGSHLSPTLTNLVMVPIDHAITEKLHNYNRHHYVYTRYADDITISSKYKFSRTEITKVVTDIFEEFNVPFQLNRDKTRFGSSAGRNYHVGLILNKENKISLGHEKNNRFKAMIYQFCTSYNEWNVSEIYHMMGIIAYYRSIEPDFVNKILIKYGEKHNLDILKTAKQLLNTPYIPEPDEWEPPKETDDDLPF